MATLNPVKAPAKKEVKRGAPCTMVIFGAGGDLTKRKLFPALYNMYTEKLLSKNFSLIGVDLPDQSTDQFIKQLRSQLADLAVGQTDNQAWDWIFERFQYVSGDFFKKETYSKLKELLAESDKKFSTAENHVYYLATPPKCFAEIADQLGAAGLTREGEGEGEDSAWKRVVIEKPFGHNLKTAIDLTEDLSKSLKEDQIFRIDHYLGKETVQNIMVFRFANGIFEPIWNHKFIDNVQITVAEHVGVEHRGGYYDHSGALRDMVQNHICQLIGLTAMEPPAKFEAQEIRDLKKEVFSAIRPIKPDQVFDHVVRAQYTKGEVAGRKIRDYVKEEQVDPNSTTETFVAIRLFIDNDRWKGVPFYVRTGKALARHESEIAIQFKTAPYTIFGEDAVEHLQPNTLILRIQPDEGIKLHFGAKIPGPVVNMDMVEMDFEYEDYFEKESSNGYETLLYDIMIGEPILFPRSDNLELCWRVVDPILEAFAARGHEYLYHYPAGCEGPKEAEELIKQDGRIWRQLL